MLSMFFGNGCFWGRQHLFTTELEQTLLGRSGAGITSIAGFAGGAGHATHDVCYHNAKNKSDYVVEGHAEVVQVQVPADSVAAASQIYFKSDYWVQEGADMWVRSDDYDAGSGYRALIGVPGGFSGPHMAAVRKGNVHNMTLKEGAGSDEDTLLTNTVLVMDSDSSLFHQAELCLQFNQCPQDEPYQAAYFQLNDTLLDAGTLRETSCPPNYIC
jgi:hypothetical protein